MKLSGVTRRSMGLKECLKDVLPRGRFWTDSITAVEGCRHISPGCGDHTGGGCWAEANHRLHSKNPGSGFSPEVLSGGKWNGKIIEHPERLERILPKSNHRRQKVFTYWEDIFYEGVSEDFQILLFEDIVISKDYHVICTKRPHKAFEYLRDFPYRGLSNVIIMVTMEDQERVYERAPFITAMSRMGWKVGALIEPMIGPVNLSVIGCPECKGIGGYLGDSLSFCSCPICDGTPYLSLDWVICGFENGKGKRPFDPVWAMRLQAQAGSAGVPFFFRSGLLNGKLYHESPDI